MRKVLSFVLVLSLVLGSFSMAFAATPATSGLSDIAGITNEEAIQVNYDLGIVTGNPDGTYLPEKAVNRAEFAAMITRALGVPESALSGYSTTSFKDTVGYGWAVPYLAFCQSKGIMLGDGAGNAMPGRTINTNEAITMALRAIGYTANSAELVGVWPSNYVTKAQDLGLYDDVATVVNVDKANAAQIIYNTLTVQKVSVATDGKTDFLWDGNASLNKPITLLSSGLGAKAETKAVLDPTRDSSINLTKYAGVYGTAYVKNNKVIAFVSDSKNVTGEVNAAGTKVTDADDNDYTLGTNYTSSTAVTALLNGRLANTTSLGAVAGNAFVTVNASLTGKTFTTVHAISTWEVTDAVKASTADIADLADNEFAGIDFAEVDKKIDMNSFILVGVASLDKIAKDNVVYIYTDDNSTSGEITKIAVGTEVVKGKVTSYKAADKEFVLGGKTYQTAYDAGIQGDVTKTFVSGDVGKDVELYLDAYGYVYDYKITSGSTDKYGVIEKYVGTGMTPEVKLFTASAKDSEVFTLTTDGDADLTATAAGTLIGYGLDKNGKISDAVVGLSGAGNLAGVRSITIGSTSYAISSDVVVFTTTGSGATLEVEISAIAKVDIGSLGTVSYILDDNKVVALVVDASKAARTSDDIYVVVNSVSREYDADEDATVNRIDGFSAGADFNKLTDFTTNISLAPPQLFKAKVDADGYVTSFAPTTAEDYKTGTATGAADVGSNGSALSVTNASVTTVYPISKDAVVYEAVYKNGSFDKYVKSDVDKIRANYSVHLYATKASNDTDYEGYDIVIFAKN